MSPPAAPPETDDAPVRREDLARIFHEAEKPPEAFRVGGEAEKFGVDGVTGEPVGYDGPRGVRRVFDALVQDHAWRPYAETVGGPVLALERGQASITLEPAAQLELSGAPWDSVHQVVTEMQGHLAEIAPVSREMGVVWLGVGFQPLARPEALPWVPKQRYPIMRRYLPTAGARGLDMMQRTATVQANFDYSSEADAMQKLVFLLKLGPLLNAMLANSPLIEGRLAGRKSERGHVWLHMDPTRSGLIPSLWAERRPTYEHYVEWALDAPMFLFRRGETFIDNAGQTFRAFLSEGFQGHRATRADWVNHLNSLFPEARLKRTIEARSCDALPARLTGAPPALLTGILYDARAFDEAQALVEGLDAERVEASRLEMVTQGLAARMAGRPVQELAERLAEIAAGGLERRARRLPDGRDERVHLEGIQELLARGRCPADEVLEGLDLSGDATGAILARTAI
jgi:glutamate--cysteine ligase